MAKRVTEDDKILFNTLYLKLGTYSGVAKETGFSASTVKKYIVPDFKIPEDNAVIKFTKEDIPKVFDPITFVESENWGEFCNLTPEEVVEINELKKELLI